MRMLKYLVPQIALGDLPSMCGVALIGAVIAGVYGVLHDQITYAISPEYFTHMKFKQFHYADVGLGDRVFVATIGFLAASCVGLIIAWFLARRLIPHQPRSYAYRQVGLGFAFVFACGVFSSLLGFVVRTVAWTGCGLLVLGMGFPTIRHHGYLVICACGVHP